MLRNRFRKIGDIKENADIRNLDSVYRLDHHISDR